MALGISASLVGVFSPRTVQVVVTGLTVGADFEVVGNWSGGSWAVRAGDGTATGTQLVLADVAAPINTPITYTVTHNGSSATSAAITVTYARRYVLQSLSGEVSVEFDMIRDGAQRDLAVRGTSYQIPGRPSPVRVFDIAGGESGSLTADTEGERSRTLKSLLQSGAPLLLRTDGSILDLEPVEFLAITGVSSSLIGMSRRRWTLDFEVIDDPEPESVVGLPDWEDFDTSYAGLTWADFNAEWTGSTWGQFDVYDWASRAAT